MTPRCLCGLWQGQHGTSLIAYAMSLSGGDVVLVRLASAESCLHSRFLLWRPSSGRLGAQIMTRYYHNSRQSGLKLYFLYRKGE